MGTTGTSWGGDAGVALALAGVLSAAWALRDGSALSRLRLPDTDDVMRLQQVRDWIDGQAFADVAQHRLGDGAVPMHWSRLADLVPGGTIVALTPIFGRHVAELVAVIAWPGLLFAAALCLVARIARHVGDPGAAPTAAVVAAVAYPATTIFLPGRIDHHGLQVVLLLGALLAMLRPTAARGVAAGLLIAASLVVGLETAPLLGVLGGCAAVLWIVRRDEGALLGLGIGATAGLLVARLLLATRGWDYPGCDGFTRQAWQAALPFAAMPILLTLTGHRLSHGARIVALAIVALTAAGMALFLSPGCLSPYGAVDPRLVTLWLAHVGEAQPLLATDPATAIGYAGVMIVGLVATLWQLRAAPSRGWAMLLALQLAALAVTLVQLRGAYAGAMLGAPALAQAIAAARRRGTPALAAAWLGSAGMLYPIAADAMTRATITAKTGGACDSPALLERLAALPAGTVIAPIDAGAWAIAATPHRLVAAPYHRNGAGNLAVFAFYMGPVPRARTIAHEWHAGYVLSCAAVPHGATAAALAENRAPGFRRLALLPDGAGIFAVAR